MWGGDDNRQTEYGGGNYGGPTGGNATHGGGYPAGGGYRHDDDDDLRGASHAAMQDSGESHDFFSQILDRIGGSKSSLADEDVDEGDAVQNHKKYFGGEDDGGSSTASGMGTAAAMQALKMFTSGSSGGSQSQSQSQFIGMAMSEASKLFDSQSSQGRVESGSSKESAVQKAGEMALKMYLKSQGGNSGGSGGLSGILGMASKFM